MPVCVMVPHAEPAQAEPERLHVTAWLVLPVTVAVKGCVWPVCSVTGVGATVTEIGGTTLTAAEPVELGSTVLAAVTVTAPAGTVAGAV